MKVDLRSIHGKRVLYKGIPTIVNVARFKDARGVHVYLNPTDAGFRSKAYRRMKKHVGIDFDFDITHSKRALANVAKQVKRRATRHRSTR